MARNAAILVLRITRAQLDTAAGLGQLLTGEPYLITDEGRMALATSASTYETYAKASEAGGTQSFSGNNFAVARGMYMN